MIMTCPKVRNLRMTPNRKLKTKIPALQLPQLARQGNLPLGSQRRKSLRNKREKLAILGLLKRR